jgi:hypothetical protein
LKGLRPVNTFAHHKHLAFHQATSVLTAVDSAGMQPACVAYRQFMQELHSEPYAIKAVAFWAIEACYHQAWSSVLNNAASAELREYSHRWG